MILIEAGERTDQGFEAKVHFAAQLSARGHPAVIDDTTLPETLERGGRYEAAPYLRDLTGARIDRLIVVAAEAVAEPVLIRLRQIDFAPEAPVTVIGRFPERQSRISAQSKIAYATGREPQVIDLAALAPAALPGSTGLSAAAPLPDQAAGQVPNLILLLTADALAEPGTLATLLALDHLPSLRLHVVLPGRARDHLKALPFAPARILGLADLAPAALAQLADVAVVAGEGAPSDRLAAIATDVIAGGRTLIDCTMDAAFAGTNAPVLRGPQHLAALPNYLSHTVLPNRAEIARRVAESSWAGLLRIETLETMIGLTAPVAPEPAGTGRILFLPTNGNGLGHARRAMLVVREMPKEREIAFAAFPSCIPMLSAAGYDCLPLVSKSRVHGVEHANDLVNFMRLRRALREGDRLVFDGGYVFDSIHRTILEKRLEATWIRRGLWQAGQITPSALHREGTFAQVIVPEEAFPELNTDLSFGRHIRKVGPIVGDRPAHDAATTRAKLAERLGREFRELVVTMLGGGVAADRTAQMQLLSALCERRKGCLHLTLIWPGSTVPPALYGWKNTLVCQTRNAPDYAAAADLVVTAAGYNSFHEVLYHRLPAIFVPQMAGFMDDQDRRARAASDRGLAVTVAAEELLLLEREVTAFLDGGKGAELRSALAAVDLPKCGNKAAADLVAAEDWR
ncbi:MAG TPA: glycosyltransferase [Albidovulum sp.]|uniref:glycosyltransferase n=1 Tax=Albidovulum sp. TaxID=1872424 RepID=UPI002C5BF182|nr:glycosyltransferase [Albidovulum sp.]